MATKMATEMKRPTGLVPQRLSQMFRLALHFQGVGNASKNDYDELDAVLRMNNMSVLELTATLAPSCDAMLQVCRWKGSITRCESLFQRINTTEGVCCSFNYYGLESNNYHTFVISISAIRFIFTFSASFPTGKFRKVDLLNPYV